MTDQDFERLIGALDDAKEIATNVQATICDLVGHPSAVALIQYYFISEIISGAAKENMADFIKPDEIKSIKKMIKGLIKANCKRHKYYPN